MADEILKIDQNSRWVLGAVTNNGASEIRNVRVNPITGALIVEANVTSTNTMIGSTIPGGTAGSVLFLDVGGTLAQDNANFFYDPVEHFLGLGTDTPAARLHLTNSFRYVDGNQHDDYYLHTDASGNATWVDISHDTTFIDNLINNNYFTINLANNNTFITTLVNNATFISEITNIVTTEGSLTIEDEGVPLTGLATTLNFTGSGVTASGSGAVKTITITSSAGGTVTGIIIDTANGFAGTSDGDPVTPTLTLETTVTGILIGNGTSMSAASAGTDYVAPGSITSDGITMNTDRILGRTTAGSGSIEEITIGTGLSLSAGELTATGSSLNVNSGQTSRAAASGTGTQNIAHGLGVTPALVKITAMSLADLGASPAENMSVGTATSTMNQSSTTYYYRGSTPQIPFQDGSHVINHKEGNSSTTTVLADISTLDATNIELDFTVLNAATGTVYIQWEAYA